MANLYSAHLEKENTKLSLSPNENLPESPHYSVAAPLMTISNDLPVTCSPGAQEYHTNPNDTSKSLKEKVFFSQKENSHEA